MHISAPENTKNNIRNWRRIKSLTKDSICSKSIAYIIMKKENVDKQKPIDFWIKQAFLK